MFQEIMITTAYIKHFNAYNIVCNFINFLKILWLDGSDPYIFTPQLKQ